MVSSLSGRAVLRTGARLDTIQTNASALVRQTVMELTNCQRQRLSSHGLDPGHGILRQGEWGESVRWLKKIPGYGNAESGLEWQLLKRMPSILFGGTVVLLLGFGLLHFELLGEIERKQRLWAEFTTLGVLAVHWAAVLTVSVGCIVVMVMKGPGYVADSYSLPTKDEDRAAADPQADGADADS